MVLSSTNDKTLKGVQAELKEDPTGRDQNSHFQRYSVTDATAVHYYICMACEVLGPKGDEQNGCQDAWFAWCSRSIQSVVAPGCVTNMLRDLGLQSLQDRRKQQRLTFFKIVRGLTPTTLANEFLTPINSKRLIKLRNPMDFKTTNIVADHARNNSQSYRVDPTKTAVYRYSFFSPRTTIN